MKVTCSKCGAEKSVNPEVLVKRIVKFGSVEKMNAEYQCRTCRPSVGLANIILKAQSIIDAGGFEKTSKAPRVRKSKKTQTEE